jgi:hypothetical protein
MSVKFAPRFEPSTTAKVLPRSTDASTAPANCGCSRILVNMIVIGWLLIRLHATMERPAPPQPAGDITIVTTAHSARQCGTGLRPYRR